jgi:hypothetical protein
MHDQQIQDRFIALRAGDWSYSKIMTELNVSKPTLIAWSRKYRFQIQNFKAIELETLREKWLASTAIRVNAIGEQLRKIETELARRDIATISTARLFALADALRRQIQRETGVVQFTSPIAEIPKEEYHEQVQDWKG